MVRRKIEEEEFFDLTKWAVLSIYTPLHKDWNKSFTTLSDRTTGGCIKRKWHSSN